MLTDSYDFIKEHQYAYSTDRQMHTTLQNLKTEILLKNQQT